VVKNISKLEWCEQQINDTLPFPDNPVSCLANVQISQFLQNGEWFLSFILQFNHFF